MTERHSKRVESTIYNNVTQQGTQAAILDSR